MAVSAGIEMPAEVMSLVANDQLVLHDWDLAVSTAQDFTVAEPNLQAAWRMVSETPDDPAPAPASSAPPSPSRGRTPAGPRPRRRRPPPHLDPSG